MSFATIPHLTFLKLLKIQRCCVLMCLSQVIPNHYPWSLKKLSLWFGLQLLTALIWKQFQKRCAMSLLSMLRNMPKGKLKDLTPWNFSSSHSCCWLEMMADSWIDLVLFNSSMSSTICFRFVIKHFSCFWRVHFL